jgi:hypothetical protein
MISMHSDRYIDDLSQIYSHSTIITLILIDGKNLRHISTQHYPTGVIRNCKSKKDRQHKRQKNKRTNKHLQTLAYNIVLRA